MTALELLQKKLINHSIDLAIIDDPKTVEYFVGFECQPMERILLLFVSQQQTILFTPSLEASEAKRVVDCPVYSYEDAKNPWNVIRDSVLPNFGQVASVGIDYTTLTVDKHVALQTIVATDNGTFINIAERLNELKLIKSSKEKQALLAAGDLADQAIQVGIDSLKVGVSEQEVVANIQYEMNKLGVSEMSFPTMVLFGDHAASPHGSPGGRKLKENEFVLFDLGVIYKGYASDITRTVYFGEESAISDRERLVYETVLKAQLKSQNSVRPGVTASELDDQARKIIHEAGFGEYFIHRLGHGIGQTAHEFPSIDSSNHQKLVKGMAFSIEPGIYIPGEIGIRIEDCVYLTESGAESFTNFDKSLQVIKPK